MNILQGADHGSLLDMMRTATNVAGQVVSPLIVAAREGILDRDAYKNADLGGGRR